MDTFAQLNASLHDRYRLEREIGQGGMATVYLARDLRHERDVALKVLSPELGAVLGAERFLAEIRVTANLQHPNLLPLFDSGEANGLLFYVMPFVSGETLRARLDREKQLPVDDAVRIAVAIASALAYAHEHGVIHRDLKPENILIQAGQPVIADFGIALAVSKAGGARVTQTGLSLGTPQYMSPEQAAGDRVIDGRSDLYSLGAVTYEMLAGEPPHSGSTAQAIIAKLMTQEPQPLRALRASVPRNVSDAVGKALAKSPADRFASVADFAAALTNAAFMVGTDDDRMLTGGRRASRRAVGLAAAGAALLGALAGMAGWSAMHRATPKLEAVTRLQLAQRAGEEIVAPPQGPAIAISPDGSTLVYTGHAKVGGWQLWRRPLNDLVATPIKGTESAVVPTFSPDGRELAFGSMQDRKLRTISIDGGTALVVADSFRRGGLHWGADGSLYFRNTADGISRVSARGGTAEEITTTAFRGSGVGHLWPQLLPGGVLLYVDRSVLGEGDGKLVVARLGTKETKVLGPAVYALFAAKGYLVWATSDQTVYAAPFDPRTLALGRPIPVFDKVRIERFLGSADLTLSPDGRLFYLEGESGQEDLTWVSRTGVASKRIEISGLHTTGTGTFALSPDGKRVAASRQLETGSDIWVKQLPDGPLDRLTFEGSPNYYPSWSPDGKLVSFVSARTRERSLFVRAADGTGRDSAVFATAGGISSGRLSPDGQWLVITSDVSHHIVAVRRSDGTPHVVTAPEGAYVGAPAMSPDGRWIAYVSNETGRSEVYVRPLPDPAAGKWLVSTDGGVLPRWSPTGHELFFNAPVHRLMSATYRATPTFAVERRDVVLSDSVAAALGLTGAYEVAPDGQRFLMSIARNEGFGLMMVDNWFEELKRKVR